MGEGTLQPLEPGDEFPMLGELDVASRETATLLVNKMYMAPLFHHAPKPTDFLLLLPHRTRKSQRPTLMYAAGDRWRPVVVTGRCRGRRRSD